MLPLLWLLLWTPKLGLCSPQSQGDVMTGLVHEDMPTLYNRVRDGLGEKTIGVQPEGVGEESTTEEPGPEHEYYPTYTNHVLMLGSSNAIYKQFRKSRHSVYMVFNATELREIVREPSSLAWAGLQLHLLKQSAEQLVMVFEKYDKKSWRFVKNWMLVPSNNPEWITLDVTGVVCQWLRNRGEFEVLRLTAFRDPGNTDSVLHMKVSGINRLGHFDPLDKEEMSIHQPLLRISVYPPDQPEHVDSSWYP